ncbi:MAG: 3-methyl-2-oxobutanoate dehydrogenase subunit VorB [Chloroflexota bacterium]
MSERMFIQGNEAVGWGALCAECRAFFGYPITPQNEVTEWFAREFPKRGRVFIQSQSETGSINMVYGAAAGGVRAMTSTSSPGWGLMQETMSHLASAELPCVVVLVSRGGPGGGSVRHSQMDYLSATRGGYGGYKNIVLAPASVQETCDLVQLAFHLADKYSNPVVVLSDGLIGQLAELVEVRTIDFGPLPTKEWALLGKARHADGKKRLVHSAPGILPRPSLYHNYGSYFQHVSKRYHMMQQAETRCEEYLVDDADILVVAYGYVARSAKQAVRMARAKGLAAGLVRPVTLWPFPGGIIGKKARLGARFLVVEDSLGQMVDDVQAAAECRDRVHLLGVMARHLPTDGGMIFPERILEEVESLQ